MPEKHQIRISIPKRFRVEISELKPAAANTTTEVQDIVHAATVRCLDHVALATYLRNVATLVEKHGD